VVQALRRLGLRAGMVTPPDPRPSGGVLGRAGGPHMSATDADGVRDQHDHGATPYSRGACEACWSQAFIESRWKAESQVECYIRLLVENEGKPGHA